MPIHARTVSVSVKASEYCYFWGWLLLALQGASYPLVPLNLIQTSSMNKLMQRQPEQDTIPAAASIYSCVLSGSRVLFPCPLRSDADSLMTHSRRANLTGAHRFMFPFGAFAFWLVSNPPGITKVQIMEAKKSVRSWRPRGTDWQPKDGRIVELAYFRLFSLRST